MHTSYALPPGHRLKSANNKTSTMFEALRTPRRIILSGTPIQNELSEFHAMASPHQFCFHDYCSGPMNRLTSVTRDFSVRSHRHSCSIWKILISCPDDYSTFKRVYETPILKSRAPGCTAKEAEVGEARSAQVVYTPFVSRSYISFVCTFSSPRSRRASSCVEKQPC